MIVTERNNNNSHNQYVNEDEEGEASLDETSLDLSELVAVKPIIKIQEFHSRLVKRS